MWLGSACQQTLNLMNRRLCGFSVAHAKPWSRLAEVAPPLGLQPPRISMQGWRGGRVRRPILRPPGEGNVAGLGLDPLKPGTDTGIGVEFEAAFMGDMGVGIERDV